MFTLDKLSHLVFQLSGQTVMLSRLSVFKLTFLFLLHQNAGLPSDGVIATTISTEDQNRKKQRRKIAILLIVLAALLSLVVGFLYWQLNGEAQSQHCPVASKQREQTREENNMKRLGISVFP